MNYKKDNVAALDMVIGFSPMALEVNADSPSPTRKGSLTKI